jgi:hypothetical protein
MQGTQIPDGFHTGADIHLNAIFQATSSAKPE